MSCCSTVIALIIGAIMVAVAIVAGAIEFVLGLLMAIFA